MAEKKFKINEFQRPQPEKKEVNKQINKHGRERKKGMLYGHILAGNSIYLKGTSSDIFNLRVKLIGGDLFERINQQKIIWCANGSFFVCFALGSVGFIN